MRPTRMSLFSTLAALVGLGAAGHDQPTMRLTHAVRLAGRLVIAEKYGSVCAADDGQPDYVANGWLMAAAPELLATLKELASLGSLELPQRRDAALEQARAIIAKAEGRAE